MYQALLGRRRTESGAGRMVSASRRFRPAVEPLEDRTVPAPLAVVATVLTSSWSPPSPDPSGLAYMPSSGRLLVSDGEVDEMALYQGANTYEATLAGGLVQARTTVAFTREPTGVAVNPGNGHLFFSDDDADKVFEVRAAAGGYELLHSFGTRGYGATDPEGLAFDGARGILFLVDGSSGVVYRITPGPNGLFDGGGDDQFASFTTAGLGLADVEGIDYNADANTLFLTGPSNRTTVLETTLEGRLVRALDISAARARSPAGLAYGPSSTDASRKSLYLSDRGVDNDADPSENDGKIFEFALDGSPPPPPSPADVRTFTPSADAYAEESSPTRNTGTSNRLVADLSPQKHAYVRFDVTGVSGHVVQSAKLRLYVISGTADGPRVHPAAGGWGERTVNWNNRPALTGAALDDLGAARVGWVELDVTAAVNGDGAYSFALVPTSDDSAYFYSREEPGFAPQLVIGIGEGTSGPAAPTALAATSNLAGRVDLVWRDNSGDEAGFRVERSPDGTSFTEIASVVAGVTSYADTGLPGATTFYYRVRAFTAAGAFSPYSNVASATVPSPSSGTLSFTASADAFVEEASPDTNFGTATRLVADLSPRRETYLRFAVTGISGTTVLSAKLRVYVTGSTSDGPQVYATGAGWSEAGLTWSNRPALLDGPLDDKAAVSIGWVEFDVTAAVKGDGTCGFAVVATSGNGMYFYSREKAEFAPVLVISAATPSAEA